MFVTGVHLLETRRPFNLFLIRNLIYSQRWFLIFVRCIIIHYINSFWYVIWKTKHIPNDFLPKCRMHLLFPPPPPSLTYKIPWLVHPSLSVIGDSQLVFCNILNFLHERKSPVFRVVCLEFCLRFVLYVCFCPNGPSIYVQKGKKR
jgi:hypothetical protein